MKTLSPQFRTHLDSGATTLCHCWQVLTRKGESMGFTDHDRDLSFDGVSFEASAGFTATEIESSLGLSVDNLEAAGALSSERLDEARLLAGDFDNAEVKLWLANWQDVTQRMLLRRGNLGEITRGRTAFSAELRGLAHVLNQPKGRTFQFGCDASVGDARCKADLDAPEFRADCIVETAVENRRLAVSGAGDHADGWFTRGSAQFTSGGNAGRVGEIKLHSIRPGAVRIELWEPTAAPVTAGTTLTLRAGCDKQFTTCGAKFGNRINFRGFPHMPGDDFVLSYANRSDPGNDGESRNS